MSKTNKKIIPRPVKILIVTFISIALICLILVIAGNLFLAHLSKEPDLSPLSSFHPFKSEQAQKEYLAYYDKRSKEWPVASETRMVETSYGKTFVRISGPANGPVLVLLPSVSSTMLIWIRNVEGLSSHFRVYTVDHVYDYGRSVYTKVMKNPQDPVQWLDELLVGLGLDKDVNLMGYSFGGWLTSQYALKHPERLSSIVLVAPAATVSPLPASWAVRGILAAIPTKWTMNSMFRWAMPYLLEKEDDVSRKVVEDLRMDGSMGLRCFEFKMPVTPTVLSDDEWKSLKTRMFFIVGEKEVIYDTEKAVRRLNQVAPGSKTEIVPHASHDLPLVQNERLNDLVVEFVNR